jgi:hypothetical protein
MVMGRSMDNCPKCNSALDPTMEECPQCGILFNKWQLREENAAAGNMTRYSIANATSSTFNWIMLGTFVIVLGMVFVYLEMAG